MAEAPSPQALLHAIGLHAAGAWRHLPSRPPLMGRDANLPLQFHRYSSDWPPFSSACRCPRAGAESAEQNLTEVARSNHRPGMLDGCFRSDNARLGTRHFQRGTRAANCHRASQADADPYSISGWIDVHSVRGRHRQDIFIFFIINDSKVRCASHTLCIQYYA